jgi:folate-binding protein YgfZ
MALFTPLDGRALLGIAGEDRRKFLQGLVSNDVDKATESRAVWAALLTPQGKFLHEFFIAEIGETLYLEGEAARLADLKRRLSIYKLRSKVTISEASGFKVFAVFGSGAAEALSVKEEPGAARLVWGGLVFVDPRRAAMGARAWLPGGVVPAGIDAAPFGAWDAHRIVLGIPDGSRDIEVEKGILLEVGFEELNGVDFQKGCYVGQELTARTKYRALLKKRLVSVRLEGPVPTPGTLVTQDGAEAGEIRSVAGDRALALLRIEAIEKGGLRAGETLLEVENPA